MSALYLNAASHGLPDRAVLRRMIAHLDLEAMIGPVAATAQVEDALSQVAEDAARLLNASPGTVGFDTGTFNAWRAHVSRLPIKGRRLLVAPHEWGENVAFLRALASEHGARIEALPPLDLSAPDLTAWRACLDDDVAAIFLPMVTSVAGLRYPVEAVGALSRAPGTQVIVDAAQAIGQVEIDVARLGCDAVFATTRKWMCAPRQTALFWTAEPAHHAAIERLDTNIALRLGLGVALDHLLKRTLPETIASLSERSRQIRERAGRLKLPCLSTPQSGTTAISLAIPQRSASHIAAALESADIVAKWPNPTRDEPLSDLDQSAMKVLRLAPHLATRPADIDFVFETIAGAL